MDIPDKEDLIFSRKLYSLLESIHEVIFEADDLDTILFISTGIKNITGFGPDHYIGRSLLDFISEKDYVSFTDGRMRQINGKRFSSHLKIKCHDGSLKRIKFSIYPFIVGSNKKGYSGVIEMVRDSDSVLQELEESGQLYKSFLEASPDMILITDLSGVIEYVSKNALKMIDKESDEELIGKNYLEFLDPSSRELAKSNISHMLFGHLRGAGEYKVIKNDGSYVYTEINGEIIRDRDGSPMHMIFIIRDISARKDVESKLYFQTRLQELLMNISNTYINLPIKDYDFAVNNSLKELGEFIGADRIYLFDYNFENLTCSNSHEWCSKGVSPEIENLQNVPLEDIPEWVNTHIKGDVMYIPDVYALEKGNNIRKILEPQGIKSLLTVPLMDEKDCIGFAGIDSVMEHHSFTNEEIMLLTVFAKMIVNVKKRHKTEIELFINKENYRNLFYDTPFAYLILKGDLVVECNRAAEKLFGLCKEEIIGKSPADISPEFQEEGVPSSVLAEDYIGDAYKKGHKNFEWIHSRANGTQFLSHIRINKIIYGGSDALLINIQDITAEREAENELKKFRTIADQSNYGAAITDLEGNLIYANKTFCSMHGYSLEETKSMNLIELHSKDQYNRVYRLLDQLKSERGFTAEEVWHKRKDGSVFPTIMSAQLIVNDRGVPMFMSASVIEITKLKKSEAEVRKLTLAIEQSPVSIIVTDLNGTITYVSPAFTNITGYSADEVLGKNPRILKSGKTPNTVYKNMWETISAGKQWNGEWINRRKNGEEYYEKISINPIFDETGMLINYLALKEDITTRKRSEQEILDLNQNLEQKVSERTRVLETFFSVALDMLCISELSTTKLIKVNKAWESILGFSVSELEGKPFLELVHPDDIESTVQATSKLAKNETIIGFNNRYRTKTGEYRIIEWHSVAVGSIIYAAARDITERMIFEQSLQDSILKEKELGDMKSRFVSMASHEFRTPLASVLLSCETMLNYWKKMDEQQIIQRLNNIKDQVKHLSGVVSNVLQVSKIQEGRLSFNPKSEDIIDLIKSALREFNDDPGLVNKIVLNTLYDTLYFYFDKLLLKQVFQNIISNAVKYSQPEPKISVTLSVRSNTIKIVVKDNGIGIDEEDLTHLFEPFFRSKEVSQIEGNGLGLSIVKESVKLHGGEINVKSKIGSGSEFEITLPKYQHINGYEQKNTGN